MWRSYTSASSYATSRTETRNDAILYLCERCVGSSLTIFINICAPSNYVVFALYEIAIFSNPF